MRIEVAADGYQPPRRGLMLLQGLVIFLFLLFVLRFWYLQVLHGDFYSRVAHDTRTRSERVYATRGIILDTKGRLLAENRPAYYLTLIGEDCPDIPASLAQISQWADIPLEQVQMKYQQGRRGGKSFEPLVLAADLPFERIVQIEPQLFLWPGLKVETRQRRYYPQGELFAHVLGYVAEANDEELRQDDSLRLGDIVGKQGLEYVREKSLRGVKGSSGLEVDALGRPLAKHQDKPPLAGTNLTLTLDIDLQKAVSDALGEESGAVVVMEPETGKLRALVTHPSYDNNIFTARLTAKDWAALMEHPLHPLQNRAVQSVYPPGSVWKLVMAALLLEHGIDPKSSVLCTGQVHLGTHAFRCHKRGGHGMVNMRNSLIASCDVYYYEMAQKVGIDAIERFAKACGFGKKTDIDLPHERSGLVPGKEWKQARFHEPWQRGETLNVAIGQGFTLVTPVQMAVFVSALLNEGKLLKPSLLEEEPPEVKGELPLTAEHRAFILEAMRTTASEGTARRISRPDAEMGGKTGTAQTVRLGERRLRKEEMELLHRDHAWLTSWGRKDGKTYVVVVMAEHGGGGSATAGPITAKVYNALFGPAAPSAGPGRNSPPPAGARP
ncbi:MAG: penicillin-binding protein 2 [Desulfovibrio sp.]|jgi:penicillin-binding protein 2|nr:penicillin-binding protein 2 [Desulfovibrio sp.]